MIFVDDFFQTILTPAEILQLRAETEKRLGDANTLNNRLTTTASMAKNKSDQSAHKQIFGKYCTYDFIITWRASVLILQGRKRLIN